MKGSSKVIMGTTIAIVVLLLLVLVLVLVLLAELYYSLLFRRRNLNRATKPGSIPERPDVPQLEQVQDHQNVPSPLSSFYAQGVLEAPRRFLFPKVPSKRGHKNEGNDSDYDIEKLKNKKHQIVIPLSSLSSSSSPSPSYISLTKPKIQVQDQAQDERDHVDNDDGGTKEESIMYISNPIYDNDVFETPGCLPSRLDRSGSSGDDRKEMTSPSSPASLPLSPMKELPEKACSVALRVAKSLRTSGSECNSHNNGRSSSSSGSPYTSPSW